MKVSLILATLNEIDGMKSIMPRINKEWYDELIVIDGGSTDGTVEYCKQHGYVVKRQTGKGIRTALDQALRFVTGDIVITFTPDGNSIPEIIPNVINKMKEGYDMVIVSRYTQGARSHDDTILSGIGNRFFTLLINLLFKSKYTDSLIGFRAIKSDVIRKIKLAEGPRSLFEKVFYQYTSWDFLSSVRIAKHEMKTTDIPGDEPKRTGGIEKVNKWKVGFVLFIQLFIEKLLNNKVSN